MKYRYPALLFLLLLLSPLSLLADSGIIKSPNDPASYEYFELPNKLKVLVVSDPQADKAAAALNVGVGSFQDPTDREGMAHFLEHMLFLGTEKYPDPDAYRNFMVSHGGHDNAYTASENTVYFFELDHNYLHEALDRFSQFFVAPLFNQDLVERERQAVESEYRLKIKDDSRRVLQVLRETVNPDHPMSHFVVGNLQTLGDRDGRSIRDELIRFYDSHYSANLMTLAVLGREDTATLRKWVEGLFAAIPNHDRKPLTLDMPLYAPGQNGIRIDIESLKDIRQMTLSFSYPWKDRYYLERPALQLSHLLGHEGSGSLFSLLREKGWVNSLSAGSALNANNYATFDIDFDFTEEGISHISETTALTMQYVALIRRTGLKKWIHDELEKINEIEFAYRERVAPGNEVLGLAGNLQDFPPRLVVKAPYHSGVFDRAQLSTLLDRINPDNMRMIVTRRQAQTEKEARWYQTGYSLSPLPEKIRSGVAGSPIDARLALPGPNEFIPDDIALKEGSASSPVPQRVYEEKGLEVWHRRDDHFQVPKADIFIDIASDAVFASVRNRVLTALYLSLVNDALNEYTYAARIAGLHYGIHRSTRGLGISVSGYNDKQEVLLDDILEKMMNLEVRPERFQVKKENMTRYWENRKLDRPYRQTMREMDYLLNLDKPHTDELLQTIATLAPRDLVEYIPELFAATRITVLAHGNIVRQEAITLGKNIRRRLSQAGKAVERLPKRYALWLDDDAHIEDIAVDHDDSSIVVYYQGKDERTVTQARFAMLQQVLRAPFFNQLRTAEQLGYVVHAGGASIYRVPALQLIIQSSVAGPSRLRQRIDAFLHDYAAQLASMSAAEFATHKEGLLNELLKQDNSLAERSARYHRSLDYGYTDFQHRDALATEIRKISRESLLKFYRHVFLSGEYGRLVVENTGKVHKRAAIPAAVRIDDASAFRKQLQKYVY